MPISKHIGVTRCYILTSGTSTFYYITIRKTKIKKNTYINIKYNCSKILYKQPEISIIILLYLKIRIIIELGTLRINRQEKPSYMEDLGTL